MKSFKEWLSETLIEGKKLNFDIAFYTNEDKKYKPSDSFKISFDNMFRTDLELQRTLEKKIYTLPNNPKHFGNKADHMIMTPYQNSVSITINLFEENGNYNLNTFKDIITGKLNKIFLVNEDSNRNNENDEKFETMYDVEAYTQGQHSPDTYKATLEFYNKIPNIPMLLNGFKPIPGRFDTLLLMKGNQQYRVDFDFVRKLMKIFNTENDGSEDILYKTFPFTELVG